MYVVQKRWKFQHFCTNFCTTFLHIFLEILHHNCAILGQQFNKKSLFPLILMIILKWPLHFCTEMVKNFQKLVQNLVQKWVQKCWKFQHFCTKTCIAISGCCLPPIHAGVVPWMKSWMLWLGSQGKRHQHQPLRSLSKRIRMMWSQRSLLEPMVGPMAQRSWTQLQRSLLLLELQRDLLVPYQRLPRRLIQVVRFPFKIRWLTLDAQTFISLAHSFSCQQHRKH